MRWEVRCAASELFRGLELDFMERPEVAGTPQPQLSTGDDVALELHGSGKWLNGIVTRSIVNEVDIDFGSERWQLGSRQPDDIYNPVITQMRLRIWYVRSKL